MKAEQPIGLKWEGPARAYTSYGGVSRPGRETVIRIAFTDAVQTELDPPSKWIKLFSKRYNSCSAVVWLHKKARRVVGLLRVKKLRWLDRLGDLGRDVH